MPQSPAGAEVDVVIPATGETFTGDDGTVSVVLADHLDAHYEPTRDEIEEFASWMGMELPADEEFVWIAREGLKAPLPADWRPCRTDADEIYYFNFRTGESTWNHPMDDHFRQKFTEEKARKLAGVHASKTSPAKAALPHTQPSAMAHTTATSATRKNSDHSDSTSTSNTNSAITGNKTSTSASPTNSAITGNRTSTVTGNPNSTITGNRTSTVTGNPNSTITGSKTSTVTGNPNSTITGSKTSTVTANPGGGGGGGRIVSEAERALEQRVRREREAAFGARVAAAEAALADRLAALRARGAADAAALREAAAAARRSAEAQRAAWGGELSAKRRDEAALRGAIARLADEHKARVDAAAEAERGKARGGEERGTAEEDAARIQEAAREKCEEMKRAAEEEVKRVRAEAARRGEEAARAMRTKHAEALTAISARRTKAQLSRKEESSAGERVAAAKAEAERAEVALRAEREEQIRALRQELSGLHEARKESAATKDVREKQKDLRERAHAALVAREAAHGETEGALRSALAAEIARSNESRDAQIAAAVSAATALFAREQKVRRRFQRGDADEITRAAKEDAVSQARRTVAAEWAVSERHMRERYRDERIALIKEAEEEIEAYNAHERRVTEENTAAQLREIHQQEQEQRVQKGKRHLMKAEVKNVWGRKNAGPQKQKEEEEGNQEGDEDGVTLAELDIRLRAIEEMFAAQEAALLAELRDASRPIPIPFTPVTATATPIPITPTAATARGVEYPRTRTSTPPAHSTAPFASEALRFLSETQRDNMIRSETIRNAREEWHAEEMMHHSSAAPEALPPATKYSAPKDPAEAQLLRLIGAVGDRIEKLAGAVTLMQSKSPAPNFAELTRRSPQSPRGLVQKWSQILFDLAPPPASRSELGALLRRDIASKE